MIKKEYMEIISSTQIAKDTIQLVLKNNYISAHATPGQFLHISVTGHTLRRPLSIANVDKKAQTVTVLFKIIGQGTAALAVYEQGQMLDVLGPSGNGFPTEDLTSNSTVLLIGGGIGVPPVHFLGKRLKEMGVHVQSILGFQSESYVFYESSFTEMGDTYVVTNDGSYGHKGFVTDVTENLASFDRYYACGPLPMLKAVTEKFADKEGFVSFEERMGCGIGACYACVIPTKDSDGYKKICQHGPVFQANEVIL